MKIKVPYDALKDDKLNHEGLGEGAVHGLEQRDAHDKSVGQSTEGEEGDEPLQRAAGEEDGPQREEEEDHELGDGVGYDEFGVHLVGVVV